MRKMQLQQLDRRFNEIKAVKGYLDPPQGGWIRCIRKALGMTAQQLADRIDRKKSRVVQIEHSETEGRITVLTLRKVAEALNCNLVYAFLPKNSLEGTLETIAMRMSKELYDQIAHSMSLEDQGLTEVQQEMERKAILNAFLSGSLKHLWANDNQTLKKSKKE